jgi:hypothetical protein
MGDPYIAEAHGDECVDELCLRQSAGDSTGPELDVASDRLRQLDAGHDVRNLQATTDAQDSGDLGKRSFLLRHEIQHAVRHDDVNTCIVERECRRIAFEHIDVRQPALTRPGARTLAHVARHVDASRAAGGTDMLCR